MIAANEGLRQLRHLSLNTGHLALTARSQVDPDVIDLLLPLADAGSGPVPGLPGWHLQTYMPQDHFGQPMLGAAAWSLAQQPGMTGLAAVMCVNCWRPEMSALAWERATGAYAGMKATLAPGRRRSARPPCCPGLRYGCYHPSPGLLPTSPWRWATWSGASPGP